MNRSKQKYIRLAGIEIKGATVGLKIGPPEESMPKVIDFFAHQG